MDTKTKLYRILDAIKTLENPWSSFCLFAEEAQNSALFQPEVLTGVMNGINQKNAHLFWKNLAEALGNYDAYDSTNAITFELQKTLRRHTGESRKVMQLVIFLLQNDVDVEDLIDLLYNVFQLEVKH